MHELNICLSIIEALQAQANKNHFHQIKKLWLEVGELAGIELDALRFSFPIAASNTFAENALLNIVSIEGRAWCEVCKVNVILKNHFNPCPQCGEYDYQIVQGKELRILKIEVE